MTAKTSTIIRSATARRGLLVICAGLTATALCAMTPEPGAASPDSAAAAATLDGFRLAQLPDGLGPMVSDFDYDWDDVGFRTRVWERGPDADGAYHVDLRVGVLRSGRFTDPEAVRDFLAVYLERDPRQWALDDYRREPYRGFTEAGRVFFLAGPGVAVQVSAREGGVVSQDELVAVADGVEPAR